MMAQNSPSTSGVRVKVKLRRSGDRCSCTLQTLQSKQTFASPMRSMSKITCSPQEATITGELPHSKERQRRHVRRTSRHLCKSPLGCADLWISVCEIVLYAVGWGLVVILDGFVDYFQIKYFYWWFILNFRSFFCIYWSLNV